MPPNDLPASSTKESSDDRSVKLLTGWRRALPCYIHRGESGLNLRIFPKQLTVWTVLTVVLGYLAVGTGLYFNDRYNRGLDGISLIDRIYPPHWNRYSIARGDSYIRLAEAALQSGNFNAAFHAVRAGLARSPANLTGRQLLAEIYSVSRRFDLAEMTLLDGLAFHSANADYLRQTFGFLFSRQKDAQIVETAKQLLDQENPNRDFLIEAMSTAYYYRGNFDQAEDCLRQNQALTTKNGRLMAARIEWDRGFHDLALVLIEQLAREAPADPTIYHLQVQWLLEDGQTDRARRTSLIRRINFPTQIQPRVDLLYAFDKVHDQPAIDDESTALLHDFGSDPKAVLMLGDFAANTGRIPVADRVFEHAIQHQQNPEAAALMRVEARIVAGEYAAAVSLTHELLEQHPDWENRMAPVFNGLQAIAHFALGDRESAGLYLTSFLNLPSVRAENLVAVANRLIAVGALNEARTVLSHAIAADPLNQPALTRLIEFDLQNDDTQNLPRNLRQLLTMRRPSPTLLRSAYEHLAEDRYLFIPDRAAMLSDVAMVLAGKSDLAKSSAL